MERPKEQIKLTPGKARIFSAAFLLFGILLGFFVIPDSLFLIPASKFPYRLGLDIQGGTHLVYQADMSSIPSGERSSAMDSVRNVIERRVNLFGVAEPMVQVNRSGEDWRLIVELAGIKDVNAAIQLIGATPFLEFREVGESDEEEVVFIPTELTGRHVHRASVEFDPNTNEPYVVLDLTSEGGKIFAELTRRNVGRPLAIYLDGAPISAPIVREEITGGKAQITGGFTPQEAKDLAGRMNAGALPVPIDLILQQTVGASLGAESFARSVNAALWGFGAVVLFMLAWYRLRGVFAILALLFYIVAVLAIFKLIPVTLTIAGITGFILSLGMAVDANILVFERMKEEERSSLRKHEALRNGFRRAWSSIRDSNVSSLATAAILYWLGTSIIQGFALTLGIGILASMFSAMVVTRMFLTSFYGYYRS